LVNARPVEQKKGADKGIDGRIYFHDEHSGTKTKQILISVKGGHLQAGYVRDLRGVIEREKAAIGVLIAMENPTGPMKKEAASAGFYKSPWNEQGYPRLQIITVEQLLEGKGIDAPLVKDSRVQTIKRAPKAKARPSHKQTDFLE
jgi:site-specific DNA-methyltransferase (adenine-specific)